jgi:hypothetical protein
MVNYIWDETVLPASVSRRRLGELRPDPFRQTGRVGAGR